MQGERWFYRQRMVAKLSRSQRPWFLLTSLGAFEDDSHRTDRRTLSTSSCSTRASANRKPFALDSSTKNVAVTPQVFQGCAVP